MRTEAGVASAASLSSGEVVPTEIPGLVVAAQNVLVQGLELLEMSAEQYAQRIATPFDASVGQHYRHVVEHFQCLVTGTTQSEVNYDARPRDRRIETDKEFAAKVTRELIHALDSWNESTLGRPCTAVSSVDYESDSPSSISSSFARELAYCIGHTIHHYAIIRLACGQIGVNVPARFGYAPSTLRHQHAIAGN